MIFQISTKEHNTLQKNTLPCHLNPPEKSMLDCLEDFFQVNSSCLLPWIGKGEDQCKTVDDLRAFKDFYDFLLGASEQERNLQKIFFCRQQNCVYLHRMFTTTLDVTKLARTRYDIGPNY